MKIWHIILVIVFALIYSCSKDEEPICSDDMCMYIYTTNDSSLSKEIARLTSDLLPKPTDEDRWGQSNNLDVLINRLNQCDCIVASKNCYACFYSLPPISIINLIWSSIKFITLVL